jgi:nucleoid DNA-binding protein
MSGLKTQKNKASVKAFIASIEHEKKRADSKAILNLMSEVTGEKPSRWGESIIGFGTYTFKCASGRKGEWFQTGFSPRKQNLTLHIMPGFDRYEDLLAKLGKFKTGKTCLYINTLEEVDLGVLK